MEFEIWMAGYAATGNYSRAQFIGKSEGIDFLDACSNFRYPENITRPYDGKILIHKGEKLGFDTHYGYPTIWACRLHDNEIDARENFG